MPSSAISGKEAGFFPTYRLIVENDMEGGNQLVGPCHNNNIFERYLS